MRGRAMRPDAAVAFPRMDFTKEGFARMTFALFLSAKAPAEAPAITVDNFQDAAKEFSSETIGWATSSMVEFAIAAGLALFIVLLLIRRGLTRAVTTIDFASEAWRTPIKRMLEHTYALPLAVTALYAAARYGEAPAAVTGGLRFLFIVMAVIQAAIWLRVVLIAVLERNALEKAKDESVIAGAMGVISWIVNLAVWSVALLLILSNLGVDVTALVAGLGIGGIAVGLAAQGVVSDLFSALSILFDRPFVKGDFIVFDDVLGEVEQIGMKTTRIRALSGEQIVVANSSLLSRDIHNYRRMAERRVPFTLGVLYETPYETVQIVPTLLKSAIQSQSNVRFDRAHMTEFGESALVFEIVYYVLSRDFNVYRDTHQRVLFEIMRSFEANGVKFAYPTRTLHVAPPGAVAPARAVPKAAA